MPVVKKLHGKPNPRKGASPSREVATGSPLTLPVKRNVPPTDLAAYIIFLYGDKGVGKSSLFGELEDTITLMTEPRRRNLKIRQVPQLNEPALTWDRIRKYRDLICKDKGIQGVSLDSVDRAYALCQEYICNKANCKHPSDKNDFGKTWHLLKSEYEDLIISFLDSGKTVYGISHSRKREIKSITGDEFEQVCPTAPDACWTIWKAIADFGFYYGYVQQKRAIYLRGTELIWASCGTSEDHFLDPKGNPLLYIPVGDSPKAAFKSLQDSFHNKVYGEIYDPDATFGSDDEEEESDEDVSLPKKNFKKK